MESKPNLPRRASSHALELVRARTGNVHRTGDIDVRPTQRRKLAVLLLDAVDERLEEERSGAGAAGTSTSLCEELKVKKGDRFL